MVVQMENYREKPDVKECLEYLIQPSPQLMANQDQYEVNEHAIHINYH